MSWDPYLDLRTGVLRNRLGITDPAEFARVEADFTSARIAQLWRHPLPGDYDLAHLQRFHQVIFGDLFEWAGQLRTVTMGKGGALFCDPGDLVSTAVRVFGRLAEDGHLRGLDRAAFVDKLTALLTEINFLHPFREGNGRSQRAFLAQLSREAGHVLRWAGMDPEANRAASRAARGGDNGPLRAMLERLVDDGPGRPPAPRSPSDHQR
ncbi:Fic/DOC family protein [Pseudonocardia acaciae]|uniref:Fic/DOC family protein n=1 Tax=Pseudonocardia acaciae TaxID=551276 RepID=UPI000688573E|nr:Fic family protein [Pseudonocardia acaciae]